MPFVLFFFSVEGGVNRGQNATAAVSKPVGVKELKITTIKKKTCTCRYTLYETNSWISNVKENVLKFNQRMLKYNQPCLFGLHFPTVTLLRYERYIFCYFTDLNFFISSQIMGKIRPITFDTDPRVTDKHNFVHLYTPIYRTYMYYGILLCVSVCRQNVGQ